MRVAVLESPGRSHLELQDGAECRRPGPSEVTIAVKACGLCHSDIAAMTGDLYIPTPAVMGHEVAGIVSDLGPEVTGLSVGDHVVVSVSLPCGKCVDCVDRRSPHLCGNLFFDVASQVHFRAGTKEFAAMGAIGGFSERVTVRTEAVVKIDPDVPFEIAALLGCGVTCGVGAVLNTAAVEPGSTVAVIGLGGVGMAIVQGTVLAGARTVLGVDISEPKLASALSLGATHACDASDVEALRDQLTEGGFDYCFDAVGRGQTMKLAYDLTRRGGTTCIVGMGGKDEQLNLSANEIYYDEKRLVGSYHGSSDFHREIPMLIDAWRDGKLNLEAIASLKVPLSEINTGIDALLAGTEIRVVVVPD